VRTANSSPPSNRPPVKEVFEANIPIRREEPVKPAGSAEPAQDEPSEADEPSTAAAAVPITAQKPRLRSVEVRAANGSPAAVAAHDVPSPSVNGQVSAIATADGIDVLRAAVSSSARDEATGPSFRQQLDQRMLAVVAGEYERAREPLDLVSNEQQSLARRYIDSLIAIREGHQGDLPAAAEAALNEIDLLAETLRDMGELKIPALRLCSEVRGFGQYRVVEPAVFSSGAPAEFVLYIELGDFKSDLGEDGSYRSRFDLDTEVLTRAGDSILRLSDTDITDTCRTRRRDCFIPRLVRLPATMAPGEYVAKVTVRDKLGGKVAQKLTDFRIGAGQVGQ
jgi:hypothetical protein